MRKELTVNYKDDNYVSEMMEAFTDDGKLMSHLGANTLNSMYCGNKIKTLTIGAVGTDPEYRRTGCVREMINSIFDMAPERGWLVSMLHPFSFSYYRKFGYEKISEHKILEFPMTALDFVPRCPDFVRYTGQPEVLRDLIKVYKKFSQNRNIMFERVCGDLWPEEPGDKQRFVYIRYDSNGEPTAYIKYDLESYFWVMRAENVAMHVREIAFTDKQSLLDVLGFIRMFEGQQSNVILHNVAMCPEIDFVLRHYVHTKYTLVADMMGRILDVKGMLEANVYPKGHGHFVLRVDDTLPFTKGCYEVEYDGDKKEVKRIADTDKYDIRADIRPLAQFFYGFDSFNPYNVQFMDGVELHGEATDFFRAFPKRNAGLFEHF